MAAAGCASIIAMGLPQSTYQPLFTSQSVIDQYARDVRAADGKVVTDPLGTYFHRIAADERIDAFIIAELDKDALKGLLAGDVGLLEPLVSYRPNGVPFIDWPATERRHAFLTQTLRLNILPLARSRAYHDQILRFADAERARLGNSMTSMSAAFSGGHGLYNEHFAAQVLKPLGTDFQYLVKDSLYAVHFSELKNPRAGGVNEGMLHQIGNYSRLDFLPRSYLESLKSAGGVRHYSGCGVADLKRTSEIVRVGWGRPLGSGPLPERYAAATAALDDTRKRVEAACVEGLRAMALSGAIRSRTLQ